MNALRPAELAARVVAWHNRHPLARRITRAQVGGIGAVSLPFALATAAGDGAAPKGRPLTPLFDADWMYDATPAGLDAFALKHGAYPLEAASHWRWRHVDADLRRARDADAAGLEQRTARHLLTAVIDVDGRRVRVLVAPVADLARAPVFGRRLFSPLRLGSAASGASALAAGALWLSLAPMVAGGAAGAPASTVVAQPAASGSVALASAAPSHEPTPIAGAEPAATESTVAADKSASAPDPTVAELPAQAGGGAPTDVQPMLQDAQAAGPLVRIRPDLTEDERRAARLQADALRTAAAGPPPALHNGKVYALATPALRTREDAQAQRVLLQSLKAQVSTPMPTQLDLMATGQRWRVVWWPHPQQADAERLRVAARARGLKLELIAF